MSRMLTTRLQRQGAPAKLAVAPVAALDGVDVARGYGTHLVPLPLDRSTELTCRLGLTIGSRASVTIPAGTDDVALEYTVPAIRGLRGQLGPAGTTAAAGRRAVVPAVVGVVVLFLVAMLVVPMLR